MLWYRYVRELEGAGVVVNGINLLSSQLYEQMPAESQIEETIYVTREANKYSFNFKIGFRSGCERERRQYMRGFVSLDLQLGACRIFADGKLAMVSVPIRGTIVDRQLLGRVLSSRLGW